MQGCQKCRTYVHDALESFPIEHANGARHLKPQFPALIDTVVELCRLLKTELCLFPTLSDEDILYYLQLRIDVQNEIFIAAEEAARRSGLRYKVVREWFYWGVFTVLDSIYEVHLGHSGFAAAAQSAALRLTPDEDQLITPLQPVGNFLDMV